MRAVRRYGHAPSSGAVELLILRQDDRKAHDRWSGRKHETPDREAGDQRDAEHHKRQTIPLAYRKYPGEKHFKGEGGKGYEEYR